MTHSYQAAFREFGYAPQKSLYVERDPRSDEIEMTGPAVKFLSNPTAAVSPGEVIPQPLEDFEVVPEGLLDYR
jgi:hypothetical protein